MRLLINSVRSYAKQAPKNLKGRSKSSQEWLTRQLSDPYVEKARISNYRCRSAFKLMEIDDRYRILRPGGVTIDIGAAPGSWTQVAVQRTNANAADAKGGSPKGFVCSCDLLHFHSIEGATIFGGRDFMQPATQQLLRDALAGRLANCVLSDIAPNATGVRMLDQENITSLCYAVLGFALTMSAPQASLLVKVWDNGEVPRLERDLARFYGRVKRVKPQASRSDSAELFLLARDYVGLPEALRLKAASQQPGGATP